MKQWFQDDGSDPTPEQRRKAADAREWLEGLRQHLHRHDGIVDTPDESGVFRQAEDLPIEGSNFARAEFPENNVVSDVKDGPE